jgi:hypothetical protein
MDSMTKRMILFLGGCIPTRLLLTFLVKTYYNSNLINYLGYITLMIGIGFFTVYFLGIRKTGLETDGKPIWWNSLRPIHGTLYLTSGLTIFFGKREYAWIPLLIDTLFGLSAFLVKHQKYLRGLSE